MPEPQSSVAPTVTLRVDGGDDLNFRFNKLTWSSFVNHGYVVEASVYDLHWNEIRIFATDRYLQRGRNEPTVLEFSIKWDDQKKTEFRKAIITGLNTEGIQHGGNVEFVAVDPPSFFLNAGDGGGRVYPKNDGDPGTVGDIIKEVIEDYTQDSPVPIQVDVSKTLDNATNQWWMMRQDPKTFIISLVDWAASVTQKKTMFVVTSNDFKIEVKELAEKQGEDLGVYNVNTKLEAKDVIEFEMISNTMVAPLQSKIRVAGISAVSGRYIDRVTDPEENIATAKDATTPDKVNARIDQLRGFKKPQDPPPGTSSSPPVPKDWVTQIMAIPELSGGELGLTYDQWIDGRARTTFMSMLNFVMRIRVRVIGDPALDNSEKLGVSTCTLVWNDSEGKPYFLSGRWLIYGFEHIVSRSFWYTDLYLARIDYDAEAKKL